MIKAYFDSIEQQIIKVIQETNYELYISVAWFTNQKIYETLLSKLEDGIKIELIIRDDHINNSIDALNWKSFIDEGGTLFFYQMTNALHHKFCISDHKTILSGSYNWTYQAQYKNKENIILSSNTELIDQFFIEFEKLKARSLVAENELLNYRIPSEASIEESNFILLENDMDVELLGDDSLNLFKDDDLVKADLLYRNKKYKAVLNLLETSLSKEKAEAYYLRSWVLFRQNKFKYALDSAEKALDLGLEEADLYNLLGNCLGELKKTKLAIEYFDKAIKKEPENTPQYWNKYLTYYNIGSHSQADKVIMVLTRVATDIIRNNSIKNNELKMKAYLDRGHTWGFKDQQRKDGLKALELYNSLDANLQDLHDLDQINLLIK